MEKTEGTETHIHRIERGVPELLALRRFAVRHGHSVVAVKADSHTASYYLMRSDMYKNLPAVLLRTGDLVSMESRYSEHHQKYYWEATVS